MVFPLSNKQDNPLNFDTNSSDFAIEDLISMDNSETSMVEKFRTNMDFDFSFVCKLELLFL